MVATQHTRGLPTLAAVLCMLSMPLVVLPGPSAAAAGRAAPKAHAKAARTTTTTTSVSGAKTGGQGGLLASDGAGYCALSTGVARCWGANGLGQVGKGDHGLPVDRATTNWLSGADQILGSDGPTADYQNYCALAGGRVQCWGSGVVGQLGDGKTDIAVFGPEAALGVSGATALATDGSGYCAVVKLGRVMCWGSNQSDQLGDGVSGGTSGMPVTVKDLSGAVSLMSDEQGYCALLTGRTVKCWGLALDGVLGDGQAKGSADVAHPVAGLSGVAALASDDDGYCALLTNGQVRCWGYGSDGELGTGADTKYVDIPVRAHLDDVQALTGNDNVYCAIIKGGSVKCWGDGQEGRLGDGRTKSAALPVGVLGVSTATAVLGSGYDFCAVVAGGKVKCWGDGASGLLGDRTSGGYSAVPRDVKGLAKVSQLSTDGSSWCAASSLGWFCWGSATNGQLANGHTSGQAIVAGRVLKS